MAFDPNVETQLKCLKDIINQLNKDFDSMVKFSLSSPSKPRREDITGFPEDFEVNLKASRASTSPAMGPISFKIVRFPFDVHKGVEGHPSYELKESPITDESVMAAFARMFSGKPKPVNREFKKVVEDDTVLIGGAVMSQRDQDAWCCIKVGNTFYYLDVENGFSASDDRPTSLYKYTAGAVGDGSGKVRFPIGTEGYPRIQRIPYSIEGKKKFLFDLKNALTVRGFHADSMKEARDAQRRNRDGLSGLGF